MVTLNALAPPLSPQAVASGEREGPAQREGEGGSQLMTKAEESLRVVMQDLVGVGLG
jgi:hypothetical protein